MEKKLPKVFANSLNDVHNNENIYYSDDRSSVEENVSFRQLRGTTVEQKIKEIFNSPNYIYKAEVELELENGKVTKKIIGKNQQNLITMDNELIPIRTIKNINYK